MTLVDPVVLLVLLVLVLVLVPVLLLLLLLLQTPTSGGSYSLRVELDSCPQPTPGELRLAATVLLLCFDWLPLCRPRAGSLAACAWFTAGGPACLLVSGSRASCPPPRLDVFPPGRLAA